MFDFAGFAPNGVTYFCQDPQPPGGCAPVVTTTGFAETVQFGFDYANNENVVGTFSFIANGEIGNIATLGLADEDDFLGTFFEYYTYQPMEPDFSGASVAVVPLPASVWLLGTAVGALAARRRLRRHAGLRRDRDAGRRTGPRPPAELGGVWPRRRRIPDWHIPLTPDTAGESQRPEAVRLREALARYRQLAADGGWPELARRYGPAGRTARRAGRRCCATACASAATSAGYRLPPMPGSSISPRHRACSPFSVATPCPTRASSMSARLPHSTYRSTSAYSSLRPRSPAGTGCPRDPGPRAICGSMWSPARWSSSTGARPSCRCASSPAIRAGRRRASRTRSGRSSSIRPGPCRTPSPSRTCCPPSRPIPTFFSRLGIRVFRGSGADARELDARTHRLAAPRRRSASPTACCRNRARSTASAATSWCMDNP